MKYRKIEVLVQLIVYFFVFELLTISHNHSVELLRFINDSLNPVYGETAGEWNRCTIIRWKDKSVFVTKPSK